MATPAPTAPAAIDAATAATLELTVAELEAVRFTLAFDSSFAFVTSAIVFVRITFVARAPAPLMATPTAPPPIASDAAAVSERIVELSVA